MHCSSSNSNRLARRGMEILTARGASSGGQGRRKKASSEHVVAQLLDSPLPTPRRSCCGSAAGDTPRSLRGSGGASPRRTFVPFSWESSPGVPKDASGGGRRREALPPKPPPGRGGSGGGTPCHAHSHGRAYHGNTTDATSSDADEDDDEEEDTFSDALDRISSSDRLAAFSARLSSIDAGSRRSPSFIMDRFLPAANAIATTSADKHPKKQPRRRDRLSKHEKAPPPPPPPPATREQPKRASSDDVEHGGQESPRACGLMFFFPWNIKPVLCGFARSPARCWTPPPRADLGTTTTTASPPRRSATLGDVLAREGKRRSDGGDFSRWHEEKSGSGKEWSSPGWGMSILGTSKRYCADARKALSRLARAAADGGDSPRLSKETRSGKPAASPASPPPKIPQLKPPSESWLSHARGSNAVHNKR